MPQFMLRLEILDAGGTQNRTSGALRALGREGGVTQWLTPLVKPLRGAITLSGGKLFAGGSDGRAYAFDKRTGGVFWSIPFLCLSWENRRRMVGRFTLAARMAPLIALEESTGEVLWRYRTKGAIRGSIAGIKRNCFLWIE